jgi:hypothetical protein
MADPVPFIPKVNLAAAANMKEFVRFSRNELTVFGSNLDFDAPTWDVSGLYHLRGKQHRILLNFAQLAPRKGIIGTPMPEPFAEQIKSYIRYLVSRRLGKHPPISEINASRELLAAFLNKAMMPDLGLVDAQILDHTVQLAAARKNNDYGARVGACLQPMSKFLREKSLAAHAPIDWRHGLEWQFVKRPAMEERRAASMPSDEALQALPLVVRV